MLLPIFLTYVSDNMSHMSSTYMCLVLFGANHSVLCPVTEFYIAVFIKTVPKEGDNR